RRPVIPASSRSADLCRRRRIDPPLRLSEGRTARQRQCTDRREIKLGAQLGSPDQGHRNHRDRPFRRRRQLLREPRAAARPHPSLWGGPGAALLHCFRAATDRLGNPAAQAQLRLADPALYQSWSGLLMRAMAKVLRWFAVSLGLLIVVLLAAFGLLQTGAGKSWLAKHIT